ncbi:MAG TPA: DNA-binding protein, partial [Dysgonamonadaceae bacterium]|nr:DNA-binding protein [Dysgonamonadaceae bacterium]
MLSPITGKPMTIHREKRQMTYRKETFEVCFHTWYCEESGREFEDDTFAQLNYDQVINQYREKHNIPFP